MVPALHLHFFNAVVMMWLVMKHFRKSERFPLSLILVAVLSLLAFLPLALPSRSKPTRPVQGYSTPGLHGGSTAQPPGQQLR